MREKDDRKEDEERVREEDKGKGAEVGMKKTTKKRQMTQGCVVCLHVLNHCVTLTFGSY